MTKQFVISSGHGDKVSGAIGVLNEHTEAKKVVNKVYSILTTKYNGVGFKFHETKATTQQQNLSNIVAYHNGKKRELDVSIHFNSGVATATGSECLYYDAKSLSAKMSKATSGALGIADRGPKERKELYFLRNTNKPAILVEVCFVSSKKDAKAYNDKFDELCEAIAKVIADHLGYTKVKTTTAAKKTTSKNAKKTTSKTAGKSINQLAKEAIKGVYGNGRERQLALGDKYAAVQKEVAKLLAK